MTPLDWMTSLMVTMEVSPIRDFLQSLIYCLLQIDTKGRGLRMSGGTGKHGETWIESMVPI